MKTQINEISTEEIVERLNSCALGYHSEEDYLTRIYMEDGHHYEDNYDRIICILKEEAKRRGLKSKPATELIPGEIIKTAWLGNMIVENAHSDKFGWDMLFRGDVLIYRRRSNIRHPFYFMVPKPIVPAVM